MFTIFDLLDSVCVFVFISSLKNVEVKS